MKMTLACDHRSVDGATGTFLQPLKGFIENPTHVGVGFLRYLRNIPAFVRFFYFKENKENTFNHGAGKGIGLPPLY